MAAMKQVQIRVDVPKVWWDYLVAQTGSEERAKLQILRAGGLASSWREILLTHHQNRTGEAAKRGAIDKAEDAEITRLAKKPNKKPGPGPKAAKKKAKRPS